MRTRIGLMVVAAALWLAPNVARAQYYEVPETSVTGPLSHPRYEGGGFYIALDTGAWHLDHKIKNQIIAQRGFVDTDGSVTGLVPPVPVGGFSTALQTSQLNGSSTWTPGMELNAGWRFESGITLNVSWLHLRDMRYSVSAGPLPPNFNVGPLLENTFLFSPVTNFSPMYAGPRDIPPGNPPDPNVDATPTALYGIWNGADNMQIELLQRFDMVTIGGRIPIWQGENGRAYGLLGLRGIVLWERFKWRAVDLDFLGNGTSANNADYFNVVTNRMYGVHVGCGQEWFLADVPFLGAFSWSLEGEGSVYGDWVKARVKYEREDGATAASRARNFFDPSFGLEARASLWWYPWEAVSIRLGYNFMSLINTVSWDNPVDFNMGTVDPGYRRISRMLNGVDLGICFVF